MSPTMTIILLWLGFAGTHLTLSSVRVRPRLVARLGEGPFRGLYSLVAFAFFVPLVWAYFANKHAGPWLWALPHAATLRWLVYAGMALAFVLVVAGFMRPSPAGVVAGPAKPAGVHFITRHPLFMGIALFGLVHLPLNGSTADVAFFGGFVIFSLVGAAHQDRRKLVTNPEYRTFVEATPFIPFTGRSALQGCRALLPTAALVGIALTAVVRYFHGSWFGG
jgi:uncharacterized membrane protein